MKKRYESCSTTQKAGSKGVLVCGIQDKNAQLLVLSHQPSIEQVKLLQLRNKTNQKRI
jgi:phosphohistidine phosphatase SixA